MSGVDDPLRRIHEEPVEEGAADDSGLAPSATGGEGLERAQDAEALAQDPEKVPNRVNAGEPPRPERAGPGPDDDEDASAADADAADGDSTAPPSA